MTRQAYQIDRDRRVLVARPTRAECTGSDIAALVVELCQRIDTGEADSVVIDCGNVQLMDSCCLGRLLRLRQYTGAAGGSIALAGCRPNVAFLFEMTRLDKILGLYETTGQAVAELRERRTRPKPQQPETNETGDSVHMRTGRYAPLLTALLRAHKRKHAHAAHGPEPAPPGSAV